MAHSPISRHSTQDSAFAWCAVSGRALVAAALFAAHTALGAAAPVPTDLAALDARTHERTTALGTPLRLYRDLAYGTRPDRRDEGAGYVPHGGQPGTHRSGTFYDLYAAESLFASADARAHAPVFVFLHGGSWSQPYDKDVACLEILRRIAAKGYVVLSMNYRLQNDPFAKGNPTPRKNATFGDMLADVDTMVSYLATALPAAGLSTETLVLAGESAGGHLAMCYAWDQDAPGLPGLSLRHALRVTRVASFVGPSDFADGSLTPLLYTAAGRQIPVPSLQGLAKLLCWLTGKDLYALDSQAVKAALRTWSPVTLVKPASCPALLAYACEGAHVTPNATDSIVPVSNFISLTNRLAAAGVAFDARLFLRTKHWEVATDTGAGKGVEWIVETLAARQDAAPPPHAAPPAE